MKKQEQELKASESEGTSNARAQQPTSSTTGREDLKEHSINKGEVEGDYVWLGIPQFSLPSLKGKPYHM